VTQSGQWTKSWLNSFGIIFVAQFRWKDWFELLGIAAIVASLIFVGYQIQQDRAIARAQLGSETHVLMNAVYEAMYEPDFSEVYAKMLEDPDSLSTSEMLQINNRLDAVTDLFFRECYLVRRGVFANCDLMIRAYIPRFFGNEYAQKWWKATPAADKSFLPDWMDEEISKQDPEKEMRLIEDIKRY
jgi:hypothetical protein